MTDATTYELGRHVVVRQRKKGHRVMMVVPARLRPDGWTPCIKLPEGAPKIGSLDDPEFVNRIRRDVERLNRQLDERRARRSARHDLPALAAKYFAAPQYKSLSVSRQYRNRRNVEKILEWSTAHNHPLVETITEEVVDEHLEVYEIHSAARYDLRATWSVLLSFAVKNMRWLARHPLSKGNWYTPKPEKVALWESDVVDQYAAKAREMRQPGLAAMIVVMLWIGQRPGDMRRLRWDENYNGEWLYIEQSKTQARVNVPLPPHLQQLIADVRVEGSPYLFNDADTQTGFTYSSLFNRFSEVRHALTEDGAEKMLLRTLRHSCVCFLSESGSEVPEIASITGHSLNCADRILEKYLVDRTGAAESAMRKVHAARGYNPEDFGALGPQKPKDRFAGEQRSRKYQTPAFTPANFERLYAAKTGQHRLGPTLPGGPLFDLDPSDDVLETLA